MGRYKVCMVWTYIEWEIKFLFIKSFNEMRTVRERISPLIGIGNVLVSRAAGMAEWLSIEEILNKRLLKFNGKVIIDKISNYQTRLYGIKDKIVNINVLNNAGTDIVSSASGIICARNIIITAKHTLITENIKILSENGREIKIINIAKDPLFDIAVFTVEGDFQGVSFSEFVKEGIISFAIGFDRGVSLSLKSGIISNTNTYVITNGETIEQAISTDTTTLPGDSGGAIYNSDGEVTGMIIGENGFSMGYSIRASVIKRVLEVYNGTNIVRPLFGIEYTPVTPSTFLIDPQFGDFGAKITFISGISPAFGVFNIGDVIQYINGKKVNEENLVNSIIQYMNPGEKILVRYMRSGSVYSVEIILGISV